MISKLAQKNSDLHAGRTISPFINFKSVIFCGIWLELHPLCPLNNNKMIAIITREGFYFNINRLVYLIVYASDTFFMCFNNQKHSLK